MAKKALLRGIITAMVTPLNDQHTLDRPGLERLIEHLIAGGVHGLFPLGTTGEAAALPVELRNQVVEFICRQVDGRLPIVVCVSNTSLVEAIRLAQHARNSGATAIATAPPYYYAITQGEFLRYIEELARATRMPILLYNGPGSSHHVIEPATVMRAAQIEHVTGLKDSGMSMSYFHEVCSRLEGRDDFTLLVGPEELLAECVLLGGHGGMAAGSNIYPRLFVEIYNAATKGELAQVKRLHNEVIRFGRALYHGNNPLCGLKHGLQLLGICKGVLTEPFAGYSAEESAMVRKYIDQHRSQILKGGFPA